MRKIDLRIDVTEAVGTGEHLETTATVFLPPGGARPVSPLALFAYPGSGYNRHYYDLQLPGRAGFSQAEYHVAGGEVFVACDHLGVGESDVPKRPLDFEAVARANAATATGVISWLEEEGSDAGDPPVRDATLIGIGQSFGGFLLTLQQAHTPLFDAVAMLGWSGVHTLPPWPESLDRAQIVAGGAGTGLGHPMRPWFHFADVPEELVELDLTRAPGRAGSAAPWGTEHQPGGPAVTPARDLLVTGAVAAEAAAIAVPVLSLNGEIDVTGDPWMEPSAYRSSPDITTCVIPRMAHMHNFSGTRREFWNRLDLWARGVAELRPSSSDSLSNP